MKKILEIYGWLIAIPLIFINCVLVYFAIGIFRIEGLFLAILGLPGAIAISIVSAQRKKRLLVITICAILIFISISMMAINGLLQNNYWFTI